MGTPALAPVASQLPWVGESFDLEITSIPQAALNVPFGLIGFSKTSWESFNLPRDLAVHGMPGCTQYVSIDFSFILPRVGGVATWEIPIPNDPGVVGLAFYTQALVFDFGVNALGAVVSNAGEGVIGVR